MSRVRVNHEPGDAGWFDEGGQEHVSRSARYTIGGSLVTAQPFGPSMIVMTANETASRRRRLEAQKERERGLAS